jgi:hypothetical protein
MHTFQETILRMKMLQEGKTPFQKSKKNRSNQKNTVCQCVQCLTADICRTGSTACLGGGGEIKIPSRTGPTQG